MNKVFGSLLLVALLLLTLASSLPDLSLAPPARGADGPRDAPELAARGGRGSSEAGMQPRNPEATGSRPSGGEHDAPVKPAAYYEGDIVVDSGVWGLNETLELRGNLIIRGTGTIFLFEAAELVFVQSRPYEFGIFISESGCLVLYPGAEVRSDYLFNVMCEDDARVRFDVVPELKGVETLLEGSLVLKDHATVLLSSDAILFLGQEASYETNIVLMGHASFFCHPGAKVRSDYPFNLTCTDHSEAVIDNGELFGIYCSGSAHVSVDNSTIVRASISGGELYFSGGSEVGRIELMFKGDATGEMSVKPGEVRYWSLAANTTIAGASFWLEIENSTVLDWSLCLLDSSALTVLDSEIGSALCSDHSRIVMSNVDFYWVVCRAHSRARLVNCRGGELACLNETSVRVEDSKLGISFELRGFSGNITLVEGLVERCYFEAGVSLNVTDCLVEFWHLALIDCSDVRVVGSQLAGLLCYGTTDAEVVGSLVVNLALYGSSRALALTSNVGSASCCGSSRLVLVGSTYAEVDVEDSAKVLVYWFLTAITTLLGEPISEVAVEVYVASNDTLVASGTTDREGKACFVLLEKTVEAGGEAPVGPYEVVASYGPYVEEALIELTSNETIGLELGYTVELRCVDGDGEAVEGLLVRATSGDLVLSTTTGADGWATIEALPAQDVMLEVYMWGVPVAKLSLTWGANYTGDVVLDPVACAVYDLRIQVLDENGNPVVGADVSLVWPNGTGIMTRPTGSGGWAVFENVPSGPYKLKVSKGGYETTWSDVVLMEEDQEHAVVLRSAAPPPISPWVLISVGVGVGVVALLGFLALAMRKRAVGRSQGA